MLNKFIKKGTELICIKTQVDINLNTSFTVGKQYVIEGNKRNGTVKIYGDTRHFYIFDKDSLNNHFKIKENGKQ